jgi:hypothetical protein
MARRKRDTRTKCDIMTDDINRIASVAMDIAEYGRIGKKQLGVKGSVVGPKGSEVFYDFECNSWKKFGPGPCASFRVKRSGPGVAKLGLKEMVWVGNLYGLVKQMSRDAATLYGCKPSPTAGFEGARRRRR